MLSSGTEFDFDDEYGITRKSPFMELTFEERVFKMRAYFMDNEFPFENMSKEEKRNFRRLTKQFMLDEDGYTIKHKIHLRRKQADGE